MKRYFNRVSAFVVALLMVLGIFAIIPSDYSHHFGIVASAYDEYPIYVISTNQISSKFKFNVDSLTYHEDQNEKNNYELNLQISTTSLDGTEIDWSKGDIFSSKYYGSDDQKNWTYVFGLEGTGWGEGINNYKGYSGFQLKTFKYYRFDLGYKEEGIFYKCTEAYMSLTDPNAESGGDDDNKHPDEIKYETYNNHRYTVFDKVAETWEEAKEYCESLGGHLATISDDAENKAVYDIMVKLGYSSAYFGYSDAEQEGIWKWVNNETSTYTNWNKFQPSDEYNGEDYAMFYFKWKYEWNDGDFGFYTDASDGFGKAFICEWDGEGTSNEDIELDPDKYLSFACTSGETKFTYNILDKKFIPNSSMLNCSLFCNYTPSLASESELFFTINKIEITAPKGFSFSETGSINYLERLGPANIYTIENGDKHISYDFNIPLYPISFSEEGEFDLEIKVYGDENFVKTFNEKILVNSYNKIVDINSDYDTTDTDGDGLPDVWEKYGIEYKDEFLDLPAMGADPNKPDIFVEVDWMEGYDPNEYADALWIVYQQFADHKINLHIDAGPDFRDYVTNQEWGSKSAASEIEFCDTLKKSDNLDESTSTLKGNWEKIIDENFNNHPVRTSVFRHCIMGNKITQKKILWFDESISGLANNLPGQYFIVAFGCLCESFLAGNDQIVAIAGTFMHELGHTLGLYHGGINSNGVGDNTNFKPNYISIMNYSFQTTGLQIFDETLTNELTKWDLIKNVNYSECNFPALNEKKLIESNLFNLDNNIENLVAQGLDQDLAIKIYDINEITYTKLYFDKNSILVSSILGECDINSDGDCDDIISKDINLDNKKTVLSDTTRDWKNIIYKGGSVGGNGAAIEKTIEKFENGTIEFDPPEEAPADELINVHIHNISGNWSNDTTGHWHSCIGCEEKVDFASHISDNGVTVGNEKIYTCTVCGYVIRKESVTNNTPHTPSASSTPQNIPTTTNQSTTVSNSPKSESLSVKVENKITGKTSIVNGIKNNDKVSVKVGTENNGYYANIMTVDGMFVDSLEIKHGKVEFDLKDDVEIIIVIDEYSYIVDVSAGSYLEEDSNVIDLQDHNFIIIGSVVLFMVMIFRRKRQK